MKNEKIDQKHGKGRYKVHNKRQASIESMDDCSFQVNL